MSGTGRFDYVAYDPPAVVKQAELKEGFTILARLVERLGPSRAQSLALTKLEEAYMWVGKAIRDEQAARNGSAPLQEGRKNG